MSDDLRRSTRHGELLQFLARFEQFHSAIPEEAIRALGNYGGFSGAELFRIDAARTWVARCYPEMSQAAARRIEWIHQVIRFAASNGCDFLAAPCRSVDGQSLIQIGDRYWQLNEWLAGEPDYLQAPTEHKFRQMFAALAHFHSLSARFQSRLDCSPTVNSRLRRIRELNPIDVHAVDRQMRQQPSQFMLELYELAIDVCRLFHIHKRTVADEMSGWAAHRFRLQPCFRDIWHDHMLFVGDRLSGIVDYEAMRMDNIAVDISRLAVSLSPDNPSSLLNAFEAYSEYGNLQQNEQQLGLALNRALILMSSMNWIEWIFFERRRFDSLEPIRERISRNRRQMRFLEKTP